MKQPLMLHCICPALLLSSSPQATLEVALPADATCEEWEEHELAEVGSLTFLQSIVDEALAAGAQPYNPPKLNGREGLRGAAATGQLAGQMGETRGHVAWPLAGENTCSTWVSNSRWPLVLLQRARCVAFKNTCIAWVAKACSGSSTP